MADEIEGGMSPEGAPSGWRLDRKIPVALILSLVVQGGTFLYWGGRMSQRVDYVEEAVHASQRLDERVTRLEEQSKAIKEGVDRIEGKLNRGN